VQRKIIRGIYSCGALASPHGLAMGGEPVFNYAENSIL